MSRLASAIVQRPRPPLHQLDDEKNQAQTLYYLSEHLRNFSLPFATTAPYKILSTLCFASAICTGKQGLLFHQFADDRKQVIAKMKVSRFFAIAEAGLASPVLLHFLCTGFRGRER